MPPLRSRTVTHGRNMAGGTVVIDIPRRELRLDVPDGELGARRNRVLKSLGSYRTAEGQRPVSAALQVYAAMAASAWTGAARDTTLIAHPDQ